MCNFIDSLQLIENDERIACAVYAVDFPLEKSNLHNNLANRENMNLLTSYLLKRVQIESIMNKCLHKIVQYVFFVSFCVATMRQNYHFIIFVRYFRMKKKQNTEGSFLTRHLDKKPMNTGNIYWIELKRKVGSLKVTLILKVNHRAITL